MHVKQISDVPIILLGDMWVDLVRWIRKRPLLRGLLHAEDVELLFPAKNCEEAFNIILKACKNR